MSTSTSGIGLRHIVTMLVCALIFGILVHVSRFSPYIYEIQAFYPPAIVAPSFGIWFGIWGALGAFLGNMGSSILAGRFEVGSLWFYFAQFVAAAVPGYFFRKHILDSGNDFLRFIGWSVLGFILATAIVAWNFDRLDRVPTVHAWTRLFPYILITDIVYATLLAPFFHRYGGHHVVKRDLHFRSFFG